MFIPLDTDHHYLNVVNLTYSSIAFVCLHYLAIILENMEDYLPVCG